MVTYLSGGRVQGITASLDNLKAYYNFNESSGNLINQQTTGDGLGSNANGTASGDPTYSQTGKVGNTISFDGVGDKFTLGTTAGQWNFLHNNSDFSIAFWLKLNATPNETQGILGTGIGGSSIGLELRVKPDIGKLTVYIENGSGATSSINSSNGFVPVNTTTWYHYVVTFSNGVWNIYRDGASNESNSSSISWSSSNHSRSMELGNVNSNTPSDVKDLTGLLDEMSIWNRVLTSAEISKLYDIGVAGVALKDSSSDFLGSPPSNVPDGTRFEDVGTRRIYRRATIAGKALEFNGSSSYVYMNDTPDTNFTFGAGCTVSWNMWYKASSTGQTGRLWSQARGSGGGANERGVTFGINSGTGFNLFASTSNSDYYLNGTDANVIPNDTNWHMLTVTYDEDGGSNNLKIYIDGSSVATRSGTTSGSASNPAYYPNIGRMVSDTEYFAGLITEYSVWSKVLTTSEITELYNSGDGKVTSDVSTTGLVAYYKMDESSGDILNYGSGSNWQANNSNITFGETGKVSSQEWKERGTAV